MAAGRRPDAIGGETRNSARKVFPDTEAMMIREPPMSPAMKTYRGLGPHGFHTLAYTEWGAAGAARTVLCVHGMTRNGRDFDHLARALAGGARVVCPDVAGRGASDWLARPEDYGFPQYLADMNALVARLDVDAVDWVGTSMGGLIGMMLAAQPGTPIRRLVMNDIGALIPKAALNRLGQYVGKAGTFADPAAAEAYFREVYAPFGPLADAHWRHIAEHSIRRADDGGYRLHYDPAIAGTLADDDVDLWAVWDAVRAPVLLVRGAESDILPAAVAAEMTGRGPGATLVEFAGIGHAPALMAEDQIAVVRDFLERP